MDSSENVVTQGTSHSFPPVPFQYTLFYQNFNIGNIFTIMLGKRQWCAFASTSPRISLTPSAGSQVADMPYRIGWARSALKNCLKTLVMELPTALVPALFVSVVWCRGCCGYGSRVAYSGMGPVHAFNSNISSYSIVILHVFLPVMLLQVIFFA